MIQLTAAGKDLSQLVEKITWSGDTRQVARTLSFTVAARDSDRLLPKVKIDEGDMVLFTQDGKTLFGGQVFDIDKSASGTVTTYTAFDLMFYVNNSDVNHIFEDTPENITAWICTNLGVPFGSAAPTGIPLYMPCFGKKAYEAVLMAYTAASRQNGKKYIPLMQNVDRLCVIEKGGLCGVTLNGSANLMDASYQTSLQKLVNKILITDKSGGIVDTVEDAAAQKKYGVVQRVCKQEDGKDAAVQARSLLHVLDQTASVSAISDVRAVSGYAITIQEPFTGLCGKFYIESDTHTFTDGKAEMRLTLAFSNLMDEKEIETSNSH